MQVKYTVLSLLIVVSSSLSCLCSCEIETHSNGRLDGFWKLNSIDTLSTDRTADTSSSRIFWAVQANLLKTIDYDSGNTALLMRFNHNRDSLTLHSPVIDKKSITDVEIADKPLEDPSLLFPYGIQSLNEQFKVLLLNQDKMILESDVLRLHFVKF